MLSIRRSLVFCLILVSLSRAHAIERAGELKDCLEFLGETPERQLASPTTPLTVLGTHRRVGAGATGEVYSVRVQRGDGPEEIAVRKKIGMDPDQVALYELAGELGLGPRVLGVQAKAKAPAWWDLFGKEKKWQEIFLEYQRGETFAGLGWQRNTLPPFAEAKERFSYRVGIEKGWKNLTEAEYETLLKKLELITRIHPDPTAENLMFVQKEVKGRWVLDLVAIDWENGVEGPVSDRVKLLRELRSRK